MEKEKEKDYNEGMIIVQPLFLSRRERAMEWAANVDLSPAAQHNSLSSLFRTPHPHLH